MFRKTVKVKLAERDLTLNDLARRLGKSQSNVSQLLTGDNMRESTMHQIAEALDCDLEIKLVDRV